MNPYPIIPMRNILAISKVGVELASRAFIVTMFCKVNARFYGRARTHKRLFISDLCPSRLLKSPNTSVGRSWATRRWCSKASRRRTAPSRESGNRVRIHSGTVIGADGFGYVLDGGAHRKVPQIGCVVIRDDVEIGANVAIDRGALGPTVIGKGSKIDNLVQIAHNVTLGEHCLIVSQAGIAGSTKLGNYVALGGQVGLAGHLRIGHRVTIAAQSGVMHNIPDGEKWFGYPAQPDRQTKRQIIALQQLPDLLKRVSELEKKLGLKATEPASPQPPKEPL